MSFPVFGMNWQAEAQSRRLAELKEENKKAQSELVKLLQEQAEWNKQTSAQLGRLEQALAAQEKMSEEHEELKVENQALLLLMVPVVYYCARETLKNLSLFL